MRKFISMLLIFSSFASASRADVNSTSLFPNNDATISPLKRGQVAPYSGVLFSQPASARIITELNSTKDKIKLEVDKSVSNAIANKQLELNIIGGRYKKDVSDLKAQVTEKTNAIIQLEKALKETEKKINQISSSTPDRSTWFMFGFVGGVVLTVGISFAVVYAIK